MAGKFLNTSQESILSNIINTGKSIINNPFYMFSDKKGSDAIYYNINTSMTTLDEATRVNYSELGTNSPIKFNKIYNMLLFGINRIDFNYDVTEIGLESDPITGEALILPNTIVPYPGDYFLLTQINKPYLFKVTAVNQNILDDESVMYRINYTLIYTKQTPIDSQVVKEFKMISGNIGTNFSCIIESNEYDTIKTIEEYTLKLKEYFYSIFYNSKVQSFTYKRANNVRIYDPYLIEFIIRNKILDGMSKYIHVCQQMFLDNMFSVIYDKTIFAAFENKDFDEKTLVSGNAYLCQQTMSLLYAFVEDYYYMEYRGFNTLLYPIRIFGDLDIHTAIINNCNTNNALINIIIKYFNNVEITIDDLKELREIDYFENYELYYCIPMVIFCLEESIKNSLIKH